MTESEEKLIRTELRSFLDEAMRLTAMPAKRKKQLLGLYLIADRLPADGEWTERELNEALLALHTFGDPATIRRTLIDLSVLERDAYGRRYTVKEKPCLEEFLRRGLN